MKSARPWCRPDAGRVWAYTGAILGGAVSIAANVAHSYVPPSVGPDGKTPLTVNELAKWGPQPGAVALAIFWPVALFVVIEIFARNDWKPGRRWFLLRFGGLIPVATVAAVVSYRHLSGLLGFYREDGLTVVIGPLAVDGLMVMATAALIATSGVRAGRDQTPVAATRLDTVTPTALDMELDTEPSDGMDIDQSPELDNATDIRVPALRTPLRSGARTSKRATDRTARTDTAAAIAKARKNNPEATQAEIAKKVGCSEKTAYRHWKSTEPSNVTPIHKEAQA